MPETEPGDTMRQVNTNTQNFSALPQIYQDYAKLANYYSVDNKATPGFKHKYGSSSYATQSHVGTGTVMGTTTKNSNTKSIRPQSDTS